MSRQISEPMVRVSYMYAAISIAVDNERRRNLLNAFVALILVLAAGWGYAQLVRTMGAPPKLIGAVAVVSQLIVFICAMAARTGEHFAALVRWIMAHSRGFYLLVTMVILAWAALFFHENIRAYWRDVVDIVTRITG